MTIDIRAWTGRSAAKPPRPSGAAELGARAWRSCAIWAPRRCLPLAVAQPCGVGRSSGEEVVRQIESLGVQSLGLTVVTSVLIGMVMGTQFAFGLSRFGGIEYLGRLVGTGFARELAPGLMAIIVGSRIGAGITAELGSMAVTEQLDAIRALGADPVKKLVLPRVLAAMIVLPIVGTFAFVLGVLGAMFAVDAQFDLPAAFFYRTALDELVIRGLSDGGAQDARVWLPDRAHQLLPGAGDARRHRRSGSGDDPLRRRDRDRHLDRRSLA